MRALGEIQHFYDLCEEISLFSLLASRLLVHFCLLSSCVPDSPWVDMCISSIGLMLRYNGSIDFYKKPYRHLFSPFLYLSWSGNKPFADLPLSSSALSNISTPLYLQGKVETLYCGIDCSLLSGPHLSLCSLDLNFLQ